MPKWKQFISKKGFPYQLNQLTRSLTRFRLSGDRRRQLWARDVARGGRWASWRLFHHAHSRKQVQTFQRQRQRQIQWQRQIQQQRQIQGVGGAHTMAKTRLEYLWLYYSKLNERNFFDKENGTIPINPTASACYVDWPYNFVWSKMRFSRCKWYKYQAVISLPFYMRGDVHTLQGNVVNRSQRGIGDWLIWLSAPLLIPYSSKILRKLVNTFSWCPWTGTEYE